MNYVKNYLYTPKFYLCIDTILVPRKKEKEQTINRNQA